jgi:hypothetical protein
MAKRIRPDLIRQAYELHEQGKTPTEISRVIDVSKSQVRVWIQNPQRFSPYIDEIAVKRALDGDRKVYENLSRVEQEEFLRRSRVISQQDLKENHYNEDTGAGFSWISQLESMLGVAPGSIRRASLPDRLRP